MTVTAALAALTPQERETRKVLIIISVTLVALLVIAVVTRGRRK